MARKKDTSLYLCFIDLTKEYDSVNRVRLLDALARFGAPPRVLAVIREIHDSMKACCVRMTESVRIRSACGKVSGKDACSRHCWSACFVTAVLRVAEETFIADVAIMDNTVQLQLKKKREKISTSPAGKVDGRSEEEEVLILWGMLYVDDVGIISLSSKELEGILTVVVTACATFWFTASEAKREIMCLQTKRGGKVSFTINAAGQVYKRTIEFVYIGGASTADRDLSNEITRRLHRAWACFQQYEREIYIRPGVR